MFSVDIALRAPTFSRGLEPARLRGAGAAAASSDAGAAELAAALAGGETGACLPSSGGPAGFDEDLRRWRLGGAELLGGAVERARAAEGCRRR